MSIQAAFQPMGQTVGITTAGANTSQNDTITLFGNGTAFVFDVGSAGKRAAQPNQVRIANLGTSPVFLSFNLAARTAVIPVPGTNQLEYPVLPNSIEVFSGIVWTNPGGIGSPTLILATISAGAAQQLYLTFGEGL